MIPIVKCKTQVSVIPLKLDRDFFYNDCIHVLSSSVISICINCRIISDLGWGGGHFCGVCIYSLENCNVFQFLAPVL